MIRIGIELNDVVRNVNKQILKYYQKDIDPTLDLDDIDDKDDVFKYAKFDSNRAKNEFIYIDYPYEIFAAAKPMDKNLPTHINNWMVEMTNREDEEFVVIYYSLNEEFLTIQSSYFFLSKIGTRVREVFFPKKISEVWDRCDVVITANDEVLKEKPEDKKSVKIINTLNKDSNVESDFKYDSMDDVINDETLLDKIIDNCEKEK